MKVDYDKKSDSKYFRIKKGKVYKTIKKAPWLFFDHSKKGEVLGVEVIDASKHPMSVSVLDGRFLGCNEVKFRSKYTKVPQVSMSDVKEKFPPNAFLEMKVEHEKLTV